MKKWILLLIVISACGSGIKPHYPDHGIWCGSYYQCEDDFKKTCMLYECHCEPAIDHKPVKTNDTCYQQCDCDSDNVLVCTCND